MKAIVVVGERVAVFEGWEWSGNDEALVGLLTMLKDPNGPSGSDPCPSYTEAKRVANLLGGKVVAHDPPEYVAGTVY